MQSEFVTSKYHNKLLNFNGGSASFIEKIPKRRYFLPDDSSFRKDLSAGAPITIQFHDNYEVTDFVDGIEEYRLIMIGITMTGHKIVAKLTGIRPYFDICVPQGMIPEIFAESLKNVHKTMIDYSIVSGKPFAYFYPEPLKWVRLYFNNLGDRTKELRIVSDQNQYILGNNDASNFRNLVFRTYHIQPSGWNKIQNYEAKAPPQEFNPNLDYYIEVDYRNVKDLAEDPNFDITKYPELLNDKTIIASEDIETFSTAHENVPLHTQLHTDECFMLSQSYAFRGESEPFLVINFTSMLQMRHPNHLSIYCKNMREIYQAQAFVVGAMQPDYLQGFNSGQYDELWKLAVMDEKNYLRAASLVDPRSSYAVGCIKRKLEQGNYNYKNYPMGYTSENIKIEAGSYMSVTMLRLPGIIPVDLRPIFKRLNPKSEKSTLAYYLAENKLGSKEDMPYTTMHQVRQMCKILVAKLGVLGYDKLLEGVHALIAQHGAEYTELINRKEAGRFAGYPHNFVGMRLDKILSYLELAPKVAYYCDQDASLCHKLLLKRNIINDKRDVCRMSYNDMYDAIYRADGAKIINFVLKHAIDEGYIADNASKYGIKEQVFAYITETSTDKTGKTLTTQKPVLVGELKYPGAFVTPPKKGLYRDTAAVKKERRQRDAEYLKKEQGNEKKTFGSVSVTSGSNEDSAQNIDNDYSDETDRPSSGLDFSSLYPNVDKTVNGSPDKVLDKRLYTPVFHYRNTLGNFSEDIYSVAIGEKTYYCKPIRYYYKGYENVPEKDKFYVDEFLIQHTCVTGPGQVYHKPELMGVIPKIFIILGDARTKVKKQMGYYAEPLEFLSGLKPAQYSSPETLRSCLEEVQESRRQLYATKKKPFFADQIASGERVLKFLEKHLFAEIKDDNWLTLFCSLLETCKFYYTYYNSLQNAIKVFMNSIYGKLGDKTCSFYQPCISGGITTYGVRFIKAVRAFVLERGFRVLYGDTDSLYICAPEASFTEVDQLYSTGAITKLEYWTRMVEITMDKIDELKVEVAKYLRDISGLNYLVMAYEEVVFPCAYLGMKKYIGVQHQNIVNFDICKPDVSLDVFSRSHSLFIRGLEMKKRGGSDFMRKISYQIFKEAFCITENRTLQQIVFDAIARVPHMQIGGAVKKGELELSVNDFVKNIRYKAQVLDSEGRPLRGKNGTELGNAMLIRFNRRMEALFKAHPELIEDQPELGLSVPVQGEIIRYIVAKKALHVTDLLGKKKQRALGDMIEYAVLVNNPIYKRILGYNIEVNIDYYVTNELIGQLSRYITYSSEYNDHFKPEYYEDNALYKEADSAAHHEAAKRLKHLWNTQLKPYEPDVMPAFRQTSIAENILLQKVMLDKFGESGHLLGGDRNIGDILLSADVYQKDGRITVSNREKLLDKLYVAVTKTAMRCSTQMLKEYSYWYDYYDTIKPAARRNQILLVMQKRLYRGMGEISKMVNPETLLKEIASTKYLQDKIARGTLIGTETRKRNTLLKDLSKKTAELRANLTNFIKNSSGFVKAIQDYHEVNLDTVEHKKNEHGLSETADVNEAEFKRILDSEIAGIIRVEPDYIEQAHETMDEVYDLYIDIIATYYQILEIQQSSEIHMDLIRTHINKVSKTAWSERQKNLLPPSGESMDAFIKANKGK